MKERLEDFIQRHRDAFDDKVPSENSWKAIESKLPKRKIWNSIVLWRAAAVFFMALSGYLLISKNTPYNKHDRLVMKEFQDVEKYYIQQISEKVHLIDQFKGSDGLNGFTHDFQQLEAMYMVLKEEMKTHPSKEVKDALVLNLLVRIDLLNQQLHKLDQDNETDTGEEAPQDASV